MELCYVFIPKEKKSFFSRLKKSKEKMYLEMAQASNAGKHAVHFEFTMKID